MMALSEFDRTTITAFDGPTEAVVHRVGDDGLFVRIVRSGQRFIHGPCTWSRPVPAAEAGDPPHDHGIDHGTPRPGTRCLIIRSDAGRWWVISFDGWPSGG